MKAKVTALEYGIEYGLTKTLHNPPVLATYMKALEKKLVKWRVSADSIQPALRRAMVAGSNNKKVQ